MRLLFGDGAFVGTGLDLIEQDIARPAEAGGGAEIPEAGGGGGELVQDEEVLAPGNLCNKLLQKLNGVAVLQFGDGLSPNWFVAVSEVKPLHVPHISRGESAHRREGLPKFFSDQLHLRLAPTKRLLLLHNPTPNVPIEEDHFVIDPPCSGKMSRGNARLQFFNELPVVRADGQGGVGGFFYRASPSALASRVDFEIEIGRLVTPPQPPAHRARPSSARCRAPVRCSRP